MLPSQGELFLDSAPWVQVTKYDRRARELADRHYSRQTVAADQWLPPGRTLALLTRDGLALWGACENLDPAGGHRWRVTMFRREGGARASDLIRSATAITVEWWSRRYGAPAVPLTTEVDPRAVRAKRDPGRCFIRAGWRKIAVRRGLVVLQAPEASRAP